MSIFPVSAPLRIASLFSGIGGLDLGLEAAGHDVRLLSEIDERARLVLARRFAGKAIVPDVRALRSLPDVDAIVAGFPCKDLSQVGRRAGIKGPSSGIVAEVFRLVDAAKPPWVILENVPFLLSLDKGTAMDYLARELTSRGYDWAYRVVDTRAFGLPQRRRRFILVASKVADPRSILLSDDAELPARQKPKGVACGFFWTEGNTGLGLAVDAVPTLKGGTGLGIPSPPAIWLPSGDIVTPDIRDGERLQGFRSNWTLPVGSDSRRAEGYRWMLVGNAVSVPVSRWLGRRLRRPRPYDASGDEKLKTSGPWPESAWCVEGERRIASVCSWPVARQPPRLEDFLRYPARLLSARATRGFYSRATKSNLRFPNGFLASVKNHLDRMGGEAL